MTQRYEVMQRKTKIQNLVGDSILVGEPLFARQVFIHSGHDLQDVVV